MSASSCTLDRTPRLWRQSRDVRVAQPDPYYDPRLPDRAALHGVDASALAGVFRRHRAVDLADDHLVTSEVEASLPNKGVQSP